MRLLLFIIMCTSAILHCSCGSSYNSGNEDLLRELMNTDREMSAMASRIGFNKALLKFAHKDFVKMTEGANPTIGKDEFERSIGDKPGARTISWEPAGGRVAQSCELGYTWGHWRFAAGDSTYYGNYITVWSRSESGKWSMLFDGGNSTPAPVK